MHPNARLIETLYSSLRARDAEAAAACYAPDAYFEDIAFRLGRREDIFTMWRLVCDDKTELKVTHFEIVSADDERGRGWWFADYEFKPARFLPRRSVSNGIVSAFVFRRGEILRQDDLCNPKDWAKQAYPFPLSRIVGRFELLRRIGARSKLRKFLKAHPPLRRGPSP